MRAEIGKILLDNLFQERDNLNGAILRELKQQTDQWGIQCLRYEILNIDPPNQIKNSMMLEAEAERNKRRQILISEGNRQSEINISFGKQQSTIQKAEGDAESILIKTRKEAEAIKMISDQLQKNKIAGDYILTQKYLKEFESNLQSSNIVVYPESKNQKSDLMALAGLMWMQGQKNKDVQQVQKIQDIIKIQDQQQKNDDNKGYQKNEQNYDDQILYSTDEGKK